MSISAKFHDFTTKRMVLSSNSWTISKTDYVTLAKMIACSLLRGFLVRGLVMHIPNFMTSNIVYTSLYTGHPECVQF